MKDAGLCLALTCLLMGAAQSSERQLKLQHRFLNLPVTYDEEDSTTIEILIDGEPQRHLDVFLADDQPDFWTFVDVSAFQGKTAVIRADREDKSNALKNIYQSDEREYLNDAYHEKHRPQLHFSTIRGWIRPRTNSPMWTA